MKMATGQTQKLPSQEVLETMNRRGMQIYAAPPTQPVVVVEYNSGVEVENKYVQQIIAIISSGAAVLGG